MEWHLRHVQSILRYLSVTYPNVTHVEFACHCYTRGRRKRYALKRWNIGVRQVNQDYASKRRAPKEKWCLTNPVIGFYTFTTQTVKSVDKSRVPCALPLNYTDPHSETSLRSGTQRHKRTDRQKVWMNWNKNLDFDHIGKKEPCATNVSSNWTIPTFGTESVST